MHITADASEISKTVQCELTFILNVLSEYSIHLPSFQLFLLKRMLLVSHKVVFTKNEAVLLCENV